MLVGWLRSVRTCALVVLLAPGCGDLFHDTEWGTRPAPASSSGTGADGPGGAGGAGAGGGGSGVGGDAGAPPTPKCKDYCTKMDLACTAEFAMYASPTTCQASCAAFPVGTTDDKMGNTLGCRLNEAVAAASDSTHCVLAGPGGANTCGANCDGFCSIATKACPMAFADLAACQDACKAFPDAVPYSASVMSGDSLACRLYHATAASDDPATHCGHILPVSDLCAGPLGN